MGFPSATYVNGLPRYRHNRREILPESPIANATKLVLAALEYRARIVAVSVGPLAVVTIFTYLERFLILDIFEQSSDREGVFLKSCHEQSTSVFVFDMYLRNVGFFLIVEYSMSKRNGLYSAINFIIDNRLFLCSLKDTALGFWP